MIDRECIIPSFYLRLEAATITNVSIYWKMSRENTPSELCYTLCMYIARITRLVDFASGLRPRSYLLLPELQTIQIQRQWVPRDIFLSFHPRESKC
jgi:hypothetical protein